MELFVVVQSPEKAEKAADMIACNVGAGAGGGNKSVFRDQHCKSYLLYI